MKFINFCIIAVLGLIVRLVVHHFAADSFLHSLTYSPMDKWDTVLEGIFLRRSGLEVYDNDVVHQSPLALRLWSFLMTHSGRWVILCFMAFELLMMISIMKLSDSYIHLIWTKEQNRAPKAIHPTAQELVLTGQEFESTRVLSLICYCFNPYSILSCASQSTSVLWISVCVWTMIASLNKCFILSAVLCALACYLRLYPGYLIFPILAMAFVHTKSKKCHLKQIIHMGSIILTFGFTLAGLLWGSYVLEGNDWSFINSVYLYQLKFADCSPQVGVYWYLFVEMFEHFNDLFVWVFQLLLATLIVALGIRFHEEPLFLTYTVALVANVLQPYYCIGEFGYLISILPVWGYLHRYSKLAFPIPCVLLSALVLLPLFHYLWLHTGTGNVNFYFAACMVHGSGQILLTSDLMNSFVKRDYLLRVGPNLILSNGQKLSLTHT